MKQSFQDAIFQQVQLKTVERYHEKGIFRKIRGLWAGSLLAVVCMTVVGDDLVKNCRHCYSNFGFGIRLINDGGQFACPNCKSRYVLEGGFTKKVP